MKLNTTYQENRRESIAVNGNHFPNKSLCELDAIPKFAVSVNRWMPYIRSVNEAHVMNLRICISNKKRRSSKRATGLAEICTLAGAAMICALPGRI